MGVFFTHELTATCVVVFAAASQQCILCSMDPRCLKQMFEFDLNFIDWLGL